jgi:enoyl-CoA hydratase
MTTTVLRSTPRRGVTEIRFNRPRRLNAVVESLFRETLDALDEAERDRDVRVVVVTGEGNLARGAAVVDLGRLATLMARVSWSSIGWDAQSARLCCG